MNEEQTTVDEVAKLKQDLVAAETELREWKKAAADLMLAQAITSMPQKFHAFGSIEAAEDFMFAAHRRLRELAGVSGYELYKQRVEARRQLTSKA